MARARLAWVTRPWIISPRIAAQTAGLLQTPKATERTNGTCSSIRAGATIMRLSSGVATGRPFSPRNTPVPARGAEIRRCRSGRGRRQRIRGEVDLAVVVLGLVGRGERLQDVPVLLDLAVGHPEQVVERVRGAEQAALADHEDEVAFADDLVDLGVDQVAGGLELLDDGLAAGDAVGVDALAVLDVAGGVPDRFTVLRDVAVHEDRSYGGPGEPFVVLRGCPVSDRGRAVELGVAGTVRRGDGLARVPVLHDLALLEPEDVPGGGLPGGQRGVRVDRDVGAVGEDAHGLDR